MIELDPADSRFADIPTPALVLDVGVLETNIARMATIASGHGVALRPHAKSHKSAEVARRQLAAGAIGICCATLAEAEALIDAGIDNLLVTSPLAGREKCTRFAALSRRGRIAAVVDDPETVALLGKTTQGCVLDLAIDIDIGQARTGTTTAGETVALAQQIAALPGLRFVGVQGYAGHVQHIAEAGERVAAARLAASRLREVISALTDGGCQPGFVSGSGTGASGLDMREGPYTEIQAGSYPLMDAEYRTVRDAADGQLPFGQSLFVLATVVSTRRAGEITVDAGTKALAVNGPPPDFLIGVPQGSRYRFWGDEHGIIALPRDASPPPVGSRILIPPTHCDPTVNLHAAYHVVVDDGPLHIWPIIGRYRPRPVASRAGATNDTGGSREL